MMRSPVFQSNPFQSIQIVHVTVASVLGEDGVTGGDEGVVDVQVAPPFFDDDLAEVTAVFAAFVLDGF